MGHKWDCRIADCFTPMHQLHPVGSLLVPVVEMLAYGLALE